MALLDFYGQTPDYYGGLLGADELNRLRQQAQEQGTLNMATALLQAGAPSRTPGGGALAIAQGLQMGQDAYRKALNQGLQEKMAGLQVQDLIQQRAEKERAKQLFAQAYQPERTITEYEPLTPQQIERANEPGFVAPSTTKVIPASFDLSRVAPLIQAGAAGQEGIDQFLKRMSLQKAIAGDTTTLAEGATLVRTNPLTGQVETVATGAQKPKLLTGEEGNIALRLFGTNDAVELSKIPNASQAIEQASIALKKAGATSINMPTGEERKAAVLANRMNFGVQQMNQAIGKDPTAAMPNTVAETARFFTRTDFIPNKLNTEQRQIVEGAQLDVLDAALTLGTGAAYTKEQLQGYQKSYFPQIGDTDAAIKSKQARLQNLLESAQIASGRAASTVPTKMPKQPTVQYPETYGGTGLPDGVIVRKRQ